MVGISYGGRTEEGRVDGGEGFQKFTVTKFPYNLPHLRHFNKFIDDTSKKKCSLQIILGILVFRFNIFIYGTVSHGLSINIFDGILSKSKEVCTPTFTVSSRISYY